ncbi:nitroreductase family protein [uncultured Clostridium sp.]|uniref:nitroreductase family protein n=1 Tax=uncultured Clostridium sp. TaxID=59620 RepID=UPI002587AD49|nr:nitroreductase family protein [uncultured Clostridium sp.]MDU1349969.1 nitroreductase family protein [Clostridium argentinense]
MEYFEVIKKRHSVRSYKSNEIEQEKLDIILEAARLAPTAVNWQAFKVIVISTKGREEELKKIYKTDWFVEAPLILGICSIPEKCWSRRDGKSYSDVDAAIVMDHIILTATDLGLGTCWIGAFDSQAARDILELDPSWEPIAFTPIGYAKETTFKKTRKPIEDIVVYK